MSRKYRMIAFCALVVFLAQSLLPPLSVPLIADEEPVDRTSIEGVDRSRMEIGEKGEVEPEKTEMGKKSLTVSPDKELSEPEPAPAEPAKPDRVRRGSGWSSFFSSGFGKILLIIAVIAGISNN